MCVFAEMSDVKKKFSFFSFFKVMYGVSRSLDGGVPDCLSQYKACVQQCTTIIIIINTGCAPFTTDPFATGPFTTRLVVKGSVIIIIIIIIMIVIIVFGYVFNLFSVFLGRGDHDGGVRGGLRNHHHLSN